MALSIFLKIDEIDSKPNSAGHVSQIDVRSWRWGASTSALGTPAVQDLCVTKYIDRASPKLLAACFGATHIDNALLSAYDGSEASPVEYVKIKIQNAFISSIAAGGPDSDGRLTEEIEAPNISQQPGSRMEFGIGDRQGWIERQFTV